MTVRKCMRGADARHHILVGSRRLARVMQCAYGPFGNHVLTCAPNTTTSPHTLRDGAALARQVDSDHPIERMAIRALTQAAKGVENAVGDNVKTTLILTQRMLNTAFKCIDASHNVQRIKQGMAETITTALTLLNDETYMCDATKIKALAAMSCQGNNDLATLVSSACIQAGEAGCVNVELSVVDSHHIEISQGSKFASGTVSPHFFKGNPLRQHSLTQPFVYVTSQPLTTFDAIISILEFAYANGQDLLVVAPQISADALQTLVLNNARNQVTCNAIVPQTINGDPLPILQDIAILTGAPCHAFLTAALDNTHFGKAARVIVSDTQTTFFGLCAWQQQIARSKIARSKIARSKIARSKIARRKIARRKDAIAALDSDTLSHTGTEAFKNKCQQRIASLSQPTVAIHIGGAIESIQRFNYSLAQKMIKIIESAREEGLLPNGSATLIHLGSALKDKFISEDSTSKDDDYRLGRHIILSALVAITPENNTRNDINSLIDAIKTSKDFWYGADFTENKLGDCWDLELVDTAKGMRLALLTATAVCTELMLTETFLCTKSPLQ